MATKPDGTGSRKATPFSERGSGKKVKRMLISDKWRKKRMKKVNDSLDRKFAKT